MAEEHDRIDEFLEQISPELPSIDLEVEGIVERIQALQWAVKHALEQTLAERDLTHGEWNVLGMLKRPGPPYRRTPGELARHSNLTSGAMTNRLDRLEEAGLVRRLPDPDDRRRIQVELTDAGHRAWEESVDAQAQKEALIASALSPKERVQLNTLLRRLCLTAERELGPFRHGKDHG